MIRWMIAGLAIVGMSATTASADHRDDIRDAQEDVREEYREYREALRYGDPDDIRDEWEDYVEARRDLQRELSRPYDRDDRRRFYRSRRGGIYFGLGTGRYGWGRGPFYRRRGFGFGISVFR